MPPDPASPCRTGLILGALTLPGAVAVGDEPGELEDLVRRAIRHELEHGGLEKLLKAKQLVEATGVVVKPEGAVLKLIGATMDVKVEPEIRVTGTMGATMARPTMQAQGTVSPDIVEVLRSTFPALATEIQRCIGCWLKKLLLPTHIP